MKNKHTSPWAWIPTLYFAQGLPYVAVMTISVIMYKRLGISNTELAFYTGWLNLPWVIKPLWSPFIDLIKTKRWWIITMQLLIGAGLAGIAFTIPTEHFFQLTLAVFWLLAFSACSKTESGIVPENDGAAQQIVLQVANGGDLTTRAGRPMYGSEAKQTIENVKLIICDASNQVA